MSRADARRPSPRRPAAREPVADPLVEFLIDRLSEDLARVWTRGEALDDARPGLPAQVAVIDELLGTLRAGRLPSRPDLRMLLYGYGTHPDYESGWADLLSSSG